MTKYLSKEKIIYIVIGIVVATVLVFSLVWFLTRHGREAAREVREASTRIQNAINRVDIVSGDEPDEIQSLVSFVRSNTNNHSEIIAYVDFRQMLSGVVYYEDFTITIEHWEGFIEALYDYLHILFQWTNNLTFNIRNPGYINNFETIRELSNEREIPINIHRFIFDNDNNFRENINFQLNTDYGSLFLNSCFFSSDRDAHRIVFGLEDTYEDAAPVIFLNIFDRSGEEISVRNPGENFRLTIPLTAEVMRGFGGELLYDSVEYVGTGGFRQGDILDYFIASNYLYVYTNRSGRFRFVEIDEEQTLERIRTSIDRIEVWADGANWRLGDFRGIDREFSEIFINIDFEDILSDVRLFDFLVASDHVDLFNDELYAILSLMFERADNLIISERNAHYLDNFAIITDINANELQIEVSRFLRSPDKYLRLDTHFGRLSLYSNFFYERGTGADITGALNLLFSFENGTNGWDEAHDIANPIIRLAVLDQFDGDVDAQHPGRSFILAIPLSAEFMRYPDGRLRFNAVEYICRDRVERGILPRSFIVGEYLYIYANRTGRFRLTRTNNDFTTDSSIFLSDRGISPSGRQIGGQTIITRGEFWSALMEIHWKENLFWPPGGAEQFPDLAVNSTLNRQVRVGQNLGAFNIVGYPCGNFIADNPMRRSYLFSLLAGYIGAFSIEVEGLSSLRTDIILPDDFSTHWSFSSYEFLKDIGFIPYAPYNDTHIDLNAYVTLQEALDIIFVLVTAGHFNQAELR